MDRLEQLRSEVLQELTQNILPFSMRYVVDREHGGFYGHVTNDGTIQKEAPKGVVQHSRMLWAFAHAGRIVGDPDYLRIALDAHRVLMDRFWDAEHGGVYWTVDHLGQPLRTEKFAYGQAFAIYGLAEHCLAGGSAASPARAIELFHLLERHCHDPEHGGYWEACHRDWMPAPDLRVDETDLPVAKGMNTHLHVLEAYTNLLRAWDDAGLRDRMRLLFRTVADRIVNPETHHFTLFFDREWRPLSDRVSYGHDIEGSWLLVEAAEVLGDPDLLAQARVVALQMAAATLEQGADLDGGLFDEGDASGVLVRTKAWWPQAEAMVGFLNAYQLSGEPRFLDASLASWQFIRQHLVDREHGEWFQSLDEAGRPDGSVKAGLWKTPYHSVRACLQVMGRIEKLTGRP
jgi:mannobiose 2-epimerase